MAGRQVLFFSGSIGLGHVVRDLAIVRELRRQQPVEVSWLAASPADEVLREAGERVLEESAALVNENTIAESVSRGGRLNLFKYVLRARGHWSRNAELVDRALAAGRFDLLIGDETYEVALAYKRDPSRKRCPFVMLYDFVGMDATSANPLEKLGVWIWNSRWAEGWDRPSHVVDKRLFVGEIEDIPDTGFGLGLPRRRVWAKALCTFIGYVLPFDPHAYADVAALRSRLGYGSAPLVVGAIGGTAIGRGLLELCGRALPIARESMPDLQMVLVCGPRIAPESLDVPAGVTVLGYVPALHELLAACDLAVVQGGGTITLELTALRRPFLFAPIPGHCEQEHHVAGRLARHGAGVRVRSGASPAELAREILDRIGTPVTYPPIAADGAAVGAQAIAELLPG